jgi:hypothetical protein
VPAEHQRRANISEFLLDLMGRSQPDAIATAVFQVDLFQEIFQVVRRRSMAEQHVLGKHPRRRQGGEPIQMAGI